MKQGEQVILADGRTGYFQGRTKKGEALVLVSEIVAVKSKDVRAVKEWK